MFLLLFWVFDGFVREKYRSHHSLNQHILKLAETSPDIFPLLTWAMLSMETVPTRSQSLLNNTDMFFSVMEIY